MMRNLSFAFCILQIVIYVQATGIYSVIGPGSIHSNSKYTAVVSVYDAKEASQIKVGISGPSYNESKTLEVQPMTTQTVEFDVPALVSGNYKLEAAGLTGVIFENSSDLNYADFRPAIYIQTDKATYKPADLVQFRVLFLDENTRPAKIDKPISVLITDGAQNQIKQIKDIKLTKGVYTGEFQLSEQPVLGKWVLNVNIDGVNTEQKSFEVAKYVLPKFEVTIDTNKDISITDELLHATIRSKYVYGKPVKGKAKVSIGPTYSYYGSENQNLESEKIIDVDGKGHVEFDFNKDLHLSKQSYYLPSLKIVVVMEEELTGNKQNTTTTVNLHAEPFRIQAVDLPHSYIPGKPITFKIAVKNLDGSPAQDTKNSLKLIVEPPHRYFPRSWVGTAPVSTEPPPVEKPLEFESKLDKNGLATFEFTLPDTPQSYYTLSTIYRNSTAYLSSISQYVPAQFDRLTINIITESPRLGKDVTFEVVSNEKIPYFVYSIVGRGNILKSERVEVPEGRKSHIIKFTPSFLMIPKAKILVHYLNNTDLQFEEAIVNFQNDFENSIEITAPLEAKPGDDVKIDINTDPDSFVGLLAVDQSVLLLKSGNDLNKNDILNKLNDYDTSTPYLRGYGRYPGSQSGLVTLTNANYPYNNDSVPLLYDDIEDRFFLIPHYEPFVQRINGLPSTYVRKFFPETWIFQHLEMKSTDAGGFSLTKKIPDTITSWVVTGFSLNPKTGLALTDEPNKIKVFQPFFVSTNFPYSVKRGEVIAIPVNIFNYMEKALDATITMDNSDGEYDFTEATNEVDESAINEVKRVKHATIPSNSAKSISYMIRPKVVGQITIKITAVTPLAGDAIHQTLRVDPEGVTKFENNAVFINLIDAKEQCNTVDVDVPADAVKDSEYVEFSAVGNLLGPIFENLDKLVRMPYGCGEQNMVNFVPNILVMKYFETAKKNMTTVKEKAMKFMETGYQRELTYKHDDGSYSAFGKSDKAGSTWLTAYVIRSFHEAAKYINIDPKILVDGLDFLASKQAENGSFPEYGRLLDFAHQNELALTSFVLLAFFENEEHIPKYQQNINRGIEYLHNNLEKFDDQYSLAITALALQLAKDPLADKVITKMKSNVKKENDLNWWSKETQTTSTYLRPSSNDVEITSYMLLALLDKEPASNVLPIVKWLVGQRNSNGGFSSTQDTVVGLQALIKFSALSGSGAGVIDIMYNSSGAEGKMDVIKVDPENSLVLQTHVLPKSTRQVSICANGTGTALVQLSYRYNVAEKDKQPSFKLTTKVNDTTTANIQLEVCVEYMPPQQEENKESNMAVLEATLPSGYTADTDKFDQIEAVKGVKRTETKNADSTVVVYFEGLAVGDMKCLPVGGIKTHAVAKLLPAAVTVYDYYVSDRRETAYYTVASSLCDICDGVDCGEGCKK